MGLSSIITRDSCLLLLGTQPGGSRLVKYSPTGTLLFSKIYNAGTFEHVIQTPDGGFALVGTGNSGIPGWHGSFDGWVMKTDSLGNVQWQRALGGSQYDELHDITMTPDGHLVAVGGTPSIDGDLQGVNNIPFPSQGPTSWIVKLNVNTGAILWQKIPVPGTNSDGEFKQIQKNNNKSGYYILAGLYGSRSAGALYIIDTLGNIISAKPYWGTGWGDGDLYFYDMEQTPDGGILIAGTTNSNDQVYVNHGGYDGLLMKIDSIGNLKWAKCYGTASNDKFMGISKGDGNTYYLSGYSPRPENFANTEYWLVKVDDRGTMYWEQRYGGSGGDYGYDVQTFYNGTVVLTGSASSLNGMVNCNHGNGTQTDVWVLCVQDITVSTQEVVQNTFEVKKTGETTYQITTIKPTTLTLTDALGRQLHTIKMGANTTTIDLNNYAQGVYLLSAKSYKSVKLVR
jgi:hypothetical protein